MSSRAKRKVTPGELDARQGPHIRGPSLTGRASDFSNLSALDALEQRHRERVCNCSHCPGTVRMTGGPGRTYVVCRGVELPIPDDFKTPACDGCGAAYGIPEVSETLDALMQAKWREYMEKCAP